MFESNLPPDGVSSSYAVLWNAFKRHAAGYSADEKAELFSSTAKRVYRLAYVCHHAEFVDDHLSAFQIGGHPYAQGIT